MEPTLLLLDEPTNHLDLNAVIWLNKCVHRPGLGRAAASSSGAPRLPLVLGPAGPPSLPPPVCCPAEPSRDHCDLSTLCSKTQLPAGLAEDVAHRLP